MRGRVALEAGPAEIPCRVICRPSPPYSCRGSRFIRQGPFRRILFQPGARYTSGRRGDAGWSSGAATGIAVDSADPVAKWLLSGGFGATSRIRRVSSSPGDLFVDGGAHVRAYTVLAAGAWAAGARRRLRTRAGEPAAAAAAVIGPMGSPTWSCRSGVVGQRRCGRTRATAATAAAILWSPRRSFNPDGSMAVRTTTLDGALACHLPEHRAARVVMKLDLQGLEKRGSRRPGNSAALGRGRRQLTPLPPGLGGRRLERHGREPSRSWISARERPRTAGPGSVGAGRRRPARRGVRRRGPRGSTRDASLTSFRQASASAGSPAVKLSRPGRLA
jgi:hypothetical protein